MNQPKQGHTFLHEEHQFTQSAEEIIHELLDGPEEFDASLLNEAIKALRLALIHLDPSMEPEKLLVSTPP